jgi:hypothetical protein
MELSASGDERMVRSYMTCLRSEQLTRLSVRRDAAASSGTRLVKAVGAPVSMGTKESRETISAHFRDTSAASVVEV